MLRIGDRACGSLTIRRATIHARARRMCIQVQGAVATPPAFAGRAPIAAAVRDGAGEDRA